MVSDDWYDTQPDCGSCGDTGRIGRSRCRWCNPSPIRALLATWHWRAWGALARAFPNSRIAASYNEPPF